MCLIFRTIAPYMYAYLTNLYIPTTIKWRLSSIIGADLTCSIAHHITYA